MNAIPFNVAPYLASMSRLRARGKFLLLRLAAAVAAARIHKARLEAEVYLNRYRLRTKNDDDLPIVH
jgi:hypothetical protein